MRASKVRLAVFITASIMIAMIATGFTAAQVVTNGGAITVTLKEQLTAGLLARTPEERVFVDLVVAKVKDGTLPLDLVQSTFLWARYKKPYPMVYFQQALTLRAKAAGIRLQ
jgi:hypothetical protein